MIDDQEQKPQDFSAQNLELVEFQSYKALKKASIIANGVATTAAILAIIFCLYLLKLRNDDQEQMACRGRINSYSADLRDDIDMQGWAALVTITLNRDSKTPTNQDPQKIAQDMFTRIDLLKGPARQARTDAFQICQDNPDYAPR